MDLSKVKVSDRVCVFNRIGIVGIHVVHNVTQSKLILSDATTGNVIDISAKTGKGIGRFKEFGLYIDSVEAMAQFKNMQKKEASIAAHWALIRQAVKQKDLEKLSTYCAQLEKILTYVA